MTAEFLHTAKNLENRIFSTINDFNQLALQVFRFQSLHCKVYSEFIANLNINTDSVNRIEDIPFMPVEFFKSHSIICEGCHEDVVFESSGTTGSACSKHYVAFKDVYITSFLKTFQNNYGPAKDLVIFGLLPSYMERGNSSLVFMANELISQSSDKRSSFYLHNYDDLALIIKETEKQNRKSLLLGVTFALLNFAEHYPDRKSVV